MKKSVKAVVKVGKQIDKVMKKLGNDVAKAAKVITMADGKKKTIGVVYTKDPRVAKMLRININTITIVTKRRLKYMCKNKRIEHQVNLRQALHIGEKQTYVHYFIYRTWWGRLRQWFMRHGLTTDGGWSLNYKRGLWAFNVGAHHWKDVFKAIFRVVTLHPMEGFNMHILSLHHWGPDYMMDYWYVSLTVLNFDFSIHKHYKEEELEVKTK